MLGGSEEGTIRRGDNVWEGCFRGRSLVLDLEPDMSGRKVDALMGVKTSAFINEGSSLL